jgi:putative transposase
MAAGTFSQIYLQLVFAVKGRQSLISQKWEDELFKYITGIVQNKGQKLMAINGMPDHIHLLIGMKPSCRLSDLVREIKKSSNAWINEQGFIKGKFEWQEGYGAFSYSKSAIDQVAKYVMNQKEHHKKSSFREEYVDFLKKYELPFDERYLFDWLE